MFKKFRFSSKAKYRSGAEDLQRKLYFRNLRKRLTPKWIAKTIAAGARAFFVFQSPKWARTIEATFTPPRAKPPLGKLFNPIYWIVWFVQFFWSWLPTRPVRSLGPAIPAFLLGIALLMAFATQWSRGNSGKRESYMTQYVQAVSNQDFATAGVLIAALIDLSPENIDYRFERAQLEELKGNHELAVDYMRRLATNRRSARAAIWLATKEFNLDDLTSWKQEKHVLYRTLLRTAIDDTAGRASDRDSAKWMLAKYYVSVQAFSDAYSLFSELAQTRKEYASSAATLALTLGRKEDAKKHAEEASKYLQAMIATDPNNIDVRRALARAHILCDREEVAVQVLQAGKQLLPNVDFENGIGEAMVCYANRLGKEAKTDETLVKRLSIIDRAAQIAPSNDLVADAIVAIAMECKDRRSEEVDRLITSVIKSLDSGALHFIRGTIAILDDRIDEARFHLRQARLQNENMPGILNNLAVALSAKSDDNLEEALELVNVALETLPDHPYFRETRGQVLFKLGQWEKAILDLEIALTAPELHKGIYPSLVAAHRKLGQDRLADDFVLAAKSEGIEIRNDK